MPYELGDAAHIRSDDRPTARERLHHDYGQSLGQTWKYKAAAAIEAVNHLLWGKPSFQGDVTGQAPTIECSLERFPQWPVPDELYTKIRLLLSY